MAVVVCYGIIVGRFSGMGHRAVFQLCHERVIGLAGQAKTIFWNVSTLKSLVESFYACKNYEFYLLSSAEPFFCPLVT